MSTASPDLTILSTRVYRGPNIWSYEPAIHLVVDLGSLEEHPTNTIPGFVDGLLEALPGLARHSCSRGHRGGFLERLKEGTWLGHVAEHVALQLAAGGRPRHPARQDPGHRRHRPVQRRLRVRRRARRPARPARWPSGWSTTWCAPSPEFDFAAELETFLLQAERTRVRPVDPGDPRRGGVPRHPVAAAQRALPRAARPGRPPAADPRDDDVEHVGAGRRHRRRQGADDPPAGGRRSAGAAVRVGAHGRAGGPGGEPDRLPGGVQAAGRQPRPRRDARPAGRRRGARRVPDRAGGVPARLGRRRVVHHRQGLPGARHRRASWWPSPSGCPPTSSATASARCASWSTRPTPTRVAASATRRC